MSSPTITEPRSAAPVIAEPTSSPASAFSRRRLFRIIGGTGAVIAVVTVGGGTLRAFDQGVFSTGEGPAYSAWNDWRGNLDDGPINLVRSAVVAANAHNSQPWLFAVSPTSIDLYADQNRSTGANDPLGRELMISLGCALENAMLAAGPNSYLPELSLFPDGSDENHVAHIELAPALPNDSDLYDAIPHRRTNRSTFTDSPISPKTIANLNALNTESELTIFWLTSPEEMQKFKDLTILATERFIADTEQSVDSFKWWRGDWDELQAKKDGITLDAAGLPSLTRIAAKMMPAISRETSDKAWLKGTKKPQLSTATAYGIIAVRDHLSALQRLNAGRLYQRLNLQATVDELAVQPLNQTVERRDRELQIGIEPEIGTKLDALNSESGWHAVMPFRIGYPDESALKSPRRPAEEVILI